jgi:hypothetical protein
VIFDSYIALDWSASSVPKHGRDSIWLCDAGREPENPSTRAEATARVRELLLRGGRTLVGFDFPFGYPRGFADLVAPGPQPAWRRVWNLLRERIRDDDRNANNRFEVAASLNGGTGPFWGCPTSRRQTTLTSKRTCTYPHRGLAEWREVDRRTRGVQSVWKLYGAGSVGSQALTGIPRVAALRDELVDARVWPFETGFAVPDARVVFVEIWPGLVPPERHAVRDAGQVAGVVRAWAERDADGRLAELFAPADAPTHAAHEEGWIFG